MTIGRRSILQENKLLPQRHRATEGISSLRAPRWRQFDPTNNQHDKSQSKRLIAEAGYPQGVTIEVFITEREEYKTNLLIIQEQLRKVGIQLNMRVVDHTSYHNDIRRDLNTIVVYGSGQPPLTDRKSVV